MTYISFLNKWLTGNTGIQGGGWEVTRLEKSTSSLYSLLALKLTPATGVYPSEDAGLITNTGYSLANFAFRLLQIIMEPNHCYIFGALQIFKWLLFVVLKRLFSISSIDGNSKYWQIRYINLCLLYWKWGEKYIHVCIYLCVYFCLCGGMGIDVDSIWIADVGYMQICIRFTSISLCIYI